MEKIEGLDRIQSLIKSVQGIKLFSTGAQLVNFTGNLYNVTGSTEDPKKIPEHEGDSWKKLLTDKGLGSSNCYVTNIEPTGKSSHPDFSVGGHMTTRKSGIVEIGGISYLMPLCYWHNSTSRNEMAFEHTETKIIKLSGYMQGEIASSFMARYPSKKPHSLIFFDNKKGWKHKNLTSEEALSLNSKTSILNSICEHGSNTHVLLERVKEKGIKEPIFLLSDYQLPE